MNPASRSASVERRKTYRDDNYNRDRSPDNRDNRDYGGDNRNYKSRSRSIDRSPRRARSPLPNKGNVLYVGNLDRRITDDELRSRFDRYGKLESLQLIKDPNTQECRGYGFVEFVNYDDAEEAIKELDQKEFDGRKLKVERSKRGVGYERTPGQYLGTSRSNFGPRRFGGDRRDSRGPRDRYPRDRRSRSRSRSRDRERGERGGRGYGGSNGGRYNRDGGYGDRPRGDRYNNDRPRQNYRERSRSRERERRY